MGTRRHAWIVENYRVARLYLYGQVGETKGLGLEQVLRVLRGMSSRSRCSGCSGHEQREQCSGCSGA